jgi:hypothetical protein
VKAAASGGGVCVLSVSASAGGFEFRVEKSGGWQLAVAEPDAVHACSLGAIITPQVSPPL